MELFENVHRETLAREYADTSSDHRIVTVENFLLIACGIVLLEKLTGSQLVKKFPAFMEPEGSLPHSQAPRHLSLS